MSNSPTDQIYALQCLDSALRTLTVEIDGLANSADEVRAIVDRNRPVVLTKRHKMNEMERKRKEIEERLAADEQKIRDARMRMQQVRNEKELGALRREIEITREQDSALEDELLQILEVADSKLSDLKELEEELAKQETILTERQVLHRQRSDELHEEVERRRTEREAKAAEINESILNKYKLILARRGGTAVVLLERELCSGCRMQVPPQLVTQIHRKVDLVVCPSCQRILCMKPSDPTETAPTE